MRQLFIFFLLTLLVSALHAQTVDGIQIITPSLHCGTQNFAKPFTLGIKLRIADGWHTYWKNPGDSDLPFDVSVDSSTGYQIHPVQYPTPKKIVGEGSVSYGYEDSVVLLVRMFPPRHSDASPQFTLHLKWLVCKNICLPGKADLIFNAGTLDVNELKGGKALIDRWTARLPQPGMGFNLENTVTTLTLVKGGCNLKVGFNDLNAGTLTDFYPEEIEGCVIDYSRIEILKNGFTIPLQYESGPTPITHIRGIVMLDRQGYEVTIPVKQ